MKIRPLPSLLLALLLALLPIGSAVAQETPTKKGVEPAPDARDEKAADERAAGERTAGERTAGERTAGERTAPGRIARIAGTDVNVRAGPGTAFPDLDRLPRDQLVELLEVQDDWARVRVPGGVPVYVFAELVGHEAGALRGRVSATNVLVRGTAARAHLPLHDQRLPRGQELIVLAREEVDGDVWLRVLLPEEMHVWVYGKYVDPLDLTSASERTKQRNALAASAIARQDAFTDGRTRKEREEAQQRRVVAFETELDVVRRAATPERAAESHAAQAEKLAETAPTAALRDAAVALAQSVRALERARLEAELDRIQREQAAAEQAERARLAEVERRRREEQAKLDAARKAREATGLVVIRNGRVLLYASGKALLRLRSKKFRLVDYANKRVRVEGRRVEPRGSDPVFEVEHVEVLRAK